MADACYGCALITKEQTMSKNSPMDREAADRISTAAERDSQSDSATSGFADRADAAADRNEPDDDE